MSGHVLGDRPPPAPEPELYAIDAGALFREVAELACPLCPHPIGLHALGGPCQACSCNGVVSVAIVEPDE